MIAKLNLCLHLHPVSSLQPRILLEALCFWQRPALPCSCAAVTGGELIGTDRGTRFSALLSSLGFCPSFPDTVSSSSSSLLLLLPVGVLLSASKNGKMASCAQGSPRASFLPRIVASQVLSVSAGSLCL